MKDVILLISKADDPETNTVEKILKEQNKNVVRFETEKYSIGSISLTFFESGQAHITTDDGEKINSQDIGVVWYRRPGFIVPKINDPKNRAFAKEELDELRLFFYQSLTHAFWVSPIQAIRNAENKHQQLRVAQKVGFRVPKTCISNSPNDVRSFIEELNDQAAIYKTLRRPYIAERYDIDDYQKEALFVPTSLVTQNDLGSLESIANTGGIFQEHIEKEYEVRVSVFGNIIYAARLDSQKNSDAAGKIDTRVGTVTRNTGSSYTLPDSVAEKCFSVMKAYGLQFGAFDLIKTLDGEYVFLEINPNGQWLWMGNATDDSYENTMVALLTDPQTNALPS